MVLADVEVPMEVEWISQLQGGSVILCWHRMDPSGGWVGDDARAPVGKFAGKHNCTALSGRLRNFPPTLACKTMSTTGSAACLIQVNAACSEEPAQQASSGTYPVLAAVR